MLRERVGGFLLIIVSLAFIILFHIGSPGGKWVGLLLGGPFLISGVLFLLTIIVTRNVEVTIENTRIRQKLIIE